MPLFGKILIGANVVAAIAILWLGAADYAKRDRWTFAVLSEEFQINGLAVDDKETDEIGQKLAALTGKKLQQQLGVSVATQSQWLENRHTALVGEINSAAPGAAKHAKVLEIVLPLARTAEEHYEMATSKDADFNEGAPLLTKVLAPEGPFESAFAAANKGASDSYDTRRRAIARFLFSTSVAQTDYQQTLGVIGLAAYAREIDAQAVRLRDMVPQIERYIDSDRVDFIASHQALIGQILVLESALRNEQANLVKHEEQRNQHQALLAQRKKDVKDLENDISNARAAAGKALALQGDLEKALFDADAAVTKTKEAAERLERELKTKEVGR
jgi:hypothetical protein